MLNPIPQATIKQHAIIHALLWVLWFILILAMPAQDDWRYMIPFYILFVSAPAQLLWIALNMCYEFIRGKSVQGLKLLALIILFSASCLGALLFGFFIMMMKAEGNAYMR